MLQQYGFNMLPANQRRGTDEIYGDRKEIVRRWYYRFSETG
jgi:hypothetical protein